MKTVMQKKNDNPFYEKDKLLYLQSHGAEATNKTTFITMLINAWNEAKEDLQLRQMFFILVFEIGDISNRQHAIFKGKEVNGGGHAARQQFLWAMSWMRKNTKKQYYKFLMKDLFRQFVGILSILDVRVKTVKNKTQIIDIINTIEEHNSKKLIEYFVKILNKSNPVEKILIFKALTRVRISKRTKFNRMKEKIGLRSLQVDTIKNMRSKEQFYKDLSDAMGWEYIQYPNNIKFVGMNKAKAKYTGSLESVLFSNGKIELFDKDEFFLWLNTLPAGALRKVQLRLINKDKTVKTKWKASINGEYLGTWFLEWKDYKLLKQKEERVLVEKQRQGTITENEIVKLAETKKAAKVNTGGITLSEELEKILDGTADDTVLHSIMSKIKLDIAFTLIVDVSGSMGGYNRVDVNGKAVEPDRISALYATLALLASPVSDYDDFMILFGSTSRVVSINAEGLTKVNRYMQGTKITLPHIIDRTKTFAENYSNMQKIVSARYEKTNINAIANAFKTWVDTSPSEAEKMQRIEAIQSNKLFIIISDGDMNNQPSAKESMLDFLSKMDHWFGWKGGVLIWDTGTSNEKEVSKFSDIPNVFHRFGWNINSINTMFKGIDDLDMLDVYTSLQSLYKSNRYELVKKHTL